MGNYTHLAADQLYDLVLERMKDTDWRYAQAYNPSRFSGVIAKNDVMPPTQQQLIENTYPENYFRVDSHDFESFQIGIEQILQKINL